MTIKNSSDRTIDILLEIAPEILKKISLQRINTKRLEQIGYSKTEISYALTLLLDKNPNAFKKSKKKLQDSFFRVLNQDEKKLFSKEAFKDVIILQAIGLIDENDLNELIDRAMIYYNESISQPELRQIISTMLGGEESFDIDTGLRISLKRDEKIH
jgi:uncharacterized protein Smg (DUF494 family)